MQTSSLHSPQARRDSHRGFSMTELLVVIGVIAVLAGLLLAAMGGVRRRALGTQTESTMQQFARACDAFQLEHGFYPGVSPDEILAGATGGKGTPVITGTENALLHMLGGSRVASPLYADPD